jgi:hypothetical protein
MTWPDLTWASAILIQSQVETEVKTVQSASNIWRSASASYTETASDFDTQEHRHRLCITVTMCQVIRCSSIKVRFNLAVHSPDVILSCPARVYNTIGVLGFESRRGLGIFPFTTASRTALRPTQPPIQWVSGALSLGVKRPGSEADYSPPSSTEVKEWMERYLHSPNTPSWCGAQLKKSTGTPLPYLYTFKAARWSSGLTLKCLGFSYEFWHWYRKWGE